MRIEAEERAARERAEKLRIEQELRRWRPRGFRGTRGLRGMTSRKYRALIQEERHAAVR